MAEGVGGKLNVGAPTPDNLKFWEFNPPEQPRNKLYPPATLEHA